MSLRLKTIIFAVASLAVGLLSLNLLSWLVLTPSYADLEARSVRTNVERGLGALDAQLDSLATTNHEWAAWDDTYDFVQTRSSSYIESNLPDESLANLGLHLMAFVNNQGEVVYSKAIDASTQHQADPPDDLEAHLAPGSLLLAHDNTTSVVCGVLGLARGLILISARPIVTSTEEGPILGTLIFGRYVDETLVADMASTARLSLAIAPTGVSQPVQRGAYNGPGVPTADIAVEPVGGNMVEGSTNLLDVYGQPVARLIVTQDRNIYAEGEHALHYFLEVVAVGGLVLALLFVALLDRTMLRRILRLASQVQARGQTEDSTGNVSVAGNDEIGKLAGAINETFNVLSQSHTKLIHAHQDLKRTSSELEGTELELRTTANQLRRLTRHLQTLREDERVLVANEIHDQVGQGLTALKMDLSTLTRATARNEVPTPEFLQRMTELLNTILDTVRRLSTGLRPSMLEDLGLAEAIEWHLGEYGKERSVHTMLRTLGPTEEVEASRALAMFRIFQEALLVSAEDPSVTDVTVTLTMEKRYVLVVVQDNGTSVFDSETMSRRELGLSLIRERAELFGGGVSIDSSPDPGTRIVAQLPL